MKFNAKLLDPEALVQYNPDVQYARFQKGELCGHPYWIILVSWVRLKCIRKYCLKTLCVRISCMVGQSVLC